MTTIRERALKYATLPSYFGGLDMGDYDAYIKGATEQKRIDIDKACDWLFVNIGHYVNEQGFVETHELEKDFRKAMEE